MFSPCSSPTIGRGHAPPISCLDHRCCLRCRAGGVCHRRLLQDCCPQSVHRSDGDAAYELCARARRQRRPHQAEMVRVGFLYCNCDRYRQLSALASMQVRAHIRHDPSLNTHALGGDVRFGGAVCADGDDVVRRYGRTDRVVLPPGASGDRAPSKSHSFGEAS